MFDSVYVFAKGLATMDSGHSIKPVNLSCDVEKPWDDGLTLYNYLDAVVSYCVADRIKICTWNSSFVVLINYNLK